MSALTIGALTLNPTFDSKVLNYTATTTNATNTITVIPSKGTAAIEIDVDGTPVENGTAITWESGGNTVKIRVTDGTSETVYTVVVTKTE